jgi:hypothetical protein
MALPKSLTQTLRQGQLTVGNGWRAYFAPFNQAYAVSQTSTSLGPTIYDLEVLGKFVDTPTTLPAGWFDLGYVKNFKFSPASKTGNVTSGYRGAIRAKYRAEVAEKLNFSFGEMTRMALSIACGTQVFNLLKSTASASTTGPLSSTGTAAVAMGASGYCPSGLGTYTSGPVLCVAAGSGALFPAGSYVVCDKDYDGTSFGYVGDAGANVFQGAVTDTDFIRKTSDYVQGVNKVVTNIVTGQDGLVLNGPFVGGGNLATGSGAGTSPAAGSKVQAITGFAAREGGTFIREWSAIFLLDTIDASQMLFYYPRIAPDTFTGFEVAALQNATSLSEFDLAASFDAMAFDDPLDGETVVRYSAYFPHANSSICI